MKTTGMIFNVEMVRALLDGRKTQTRRPLPEWQIPEFRNGQWIATAQKHTRWGFCVISDTEEGCAAELGKYVKPLSPGDLIWVRETVKEDVIGSESHARYVADGSVLREQWWYSRSTCPSIHMPRWASRLTLRITDVRVERLHNIDIDAAMKEGCPEEYAVKHTSVHPVHTWYASLWDSLYGTWSDNPWVWVYEFEVIHMNVDAVLKQMEAA